MSRDDIIWIYRIFLGRDPESDDAINYRINNGQSRSSMISEILQSDEFASIHIVK